MNHDDELERKLKQLKQTYDRVPTLSNAEQIANTIQNMKHHQEKRKNRRWLPLTAISILTLISLLIVMLPEFLTEKGSEESAQYSADTTKNAINENNDIRLFQRDDAANHLTIDERPTTKEDTLEIESDKQEVQTFTLVANKKLEFSTYYPADMLAETFDNGVKIMANFARTKSEKAYVEIYGENLVKMPAEKREHMLLSHFEDYMITETAEEEFIIPYSEQEYSLEKGDMVGTVSIFERNDKMFRITIHYPIEMGDGFGPRSAKIIEDLQFHD